MGVVTNQSRLKGGATVVPAFRSAGITIDPQLQELIHAATKGGRQRLKGVEDWNGTWNEYGVVPAFYPGEEVVFYGSQQGSKGWQGSALVTQVVINLPVGTKGPPTVEGTFRGVGELNLSSTETVDLPADPTSIDPTPQTCVKLSTLSNSPDYGLIQSGTNDITITLSIEDQAFHDCSSSGFMDALEGLWDANVTYSRYVEDTDSLPTEGQGYHVRVPTNAAGTEYWQFEYMRVGAMSDIMFNRETGELLNVTIPLEMSMIEDIAGVATVGSGVTKPGGGVWRPTET